MKRRQPLLYDTTYDGKQEVLHGKKRIVDGRW